MSLQAFRNRTQMKQLVCPIEMEDATAARSGTGK